MIKIAPSILSADFARLADSIKMIEDAGAEYAHIDVMDGHFVPNLSFGVPIISSIRPYSNMVFDVHLMISHPHKYVESFAKAGSDIITIHIECESDIKYTLDLIKSLGKKAGLTLNPDTPLETILPYQEDIDMLLIMSVNAGFGGQAYIDRVSDKIRQARAVFGPDFDIEVDGGIHLGNVHIPVEAGANIIVAGTAIFGNDDPAEAVRKMKENGSCGQS